MQLNEETIMLIIKIVCGSVSGICAILSVLSALFGGNWKGLYKNVKAVNDKTNKLIELIEDAETHGAYSGDDKLQFVLAKYMQWCLSSKIPYNEEDTITQINELIDMTKAVNGGLNGRRKEY